MRKYFEFYNGAKIKCGEAALMTIGAELAAAGCKAPLLLCSSSQEKLGLLDKVMQAIPAELSEKVVLYSSVPMKMDQDVVKEIEKVYVAKECDGIIAIGGDSVMDTAKCLRLFLSQNCDELLPLLGNVINKKSLAPLFVIPTENGSGREAGGELSVGETYVSTEAIVPDVVIIDEDTAMATNAKTIAKCGAFALANAIESYLYAEEEDPATAYAEKSISLLTKNLVNAAKDGDNEEACRATALACTYAGIAYGNAPFGAAHALAEAIGEITDETEDSAFSMTLVPAMKRALKDREQRLKTVFYLAKGATEYAETPDSERAQAAISAIESLFEELREVTQIYTKISQTKIMREIFGTIAEAAANRRSAITAFSPITKDEFIALLNEAY